MPNRSGCRRDPPPAANAAFVQHLCHPAESLPFVGRRVLPHARTVVGRPEDPVRPGLASSGADGPRVLDTRWTRPPFHSQTKKQATMKWPVVLCLLVGASGIEPPTPTVSKPDRPKKHTKRDSTRLNQHIEVECFQGHRSCSFHCVPAGPVGVLGRCWAAGCSIRRGYPSDECLPPPVRLHSPEAITFSRCKRSGTRAWLPGSPGRCPSTA